MLPLEKTSRIEAARDERIFLCLAQDDPMKSIVILVAANISARDDAFGLLAR